MTTDLKTMAAMAAMEEVRDGMVVGLGSGSTAFIFIRELGNAGFDVVGIPASEESRRLAIEAGLRLTTFEEAPAIDLTVDGADEVSPELDLLKGRGGAMVREKIVAHASKRVVIIVDEGKLVKRLGDNSSIPVEVIPLAAPRVLRQLHGAQIRKKDGDPFSSDNGNLILDWKHGVIENPSALERDLKAMTGVVDSGIFSGVADCVIVAGRDGVRRLFRAAKP
jgi:ribose 5-phosphate isomerase A